MTNGKGVWPMVSRCCSLDTARFFFFLFFFFSSNFYWNFLIVSMNCSMFLKEWLFPLPRKKSSTVNDSSENFNYMLGWCFYQNARPLVRNYNFSYNVLAVLFSEICYTVILIYQRIFLVMNDLRYLWFYSVDLISGSYERKSLFNLSLEPILVTSEPKQQHYIDSFVENKDWVKAEIG